MKNRKCHEAIFISESGANELRAASADKREAKARGSDGSAGNAMQTIEQWCQRGSGGGGRVVVCLRYQYEIALIQECVSGRIYYGA